MSDRIIARTVLVFPSLPRYILNVHKPSCNGIASTATSRLTSHLAASGAELQPRATDVLHLAQMRRPSGPLLLTRLPTTIVLRNFLLSLTYVAPTVADIGLRVLRKIANADNALLNPDRNPVLKALIRPLIYNHFCAGTDGSEIRNTVKEIKRLGYSGVILCYAKESSGHEDANTPSSTKSKCSEVEQWTTGTLKTLEAMEAGDYLGLK